ncbi:MAG TPA: MFS transporter [Acidimicrobiia bacterium]|nr:MFS transporter [Acidimicrobiia bacterium]
MSTDPRFGEPTPFARLVYAQALSIAGDACITVSLAGSLFFQNPSAAAREKVLLYLALTMAPFAIVAPVVGPALDRSRGGRRMLVIGASAGRAFLCIVMAQYISKPAPEGLLIYPLAFGVLVLAKGQSVAKSALVPALVKDSKELVNANSRLALIGVISATVGAIPAAGVQHLFGADWSLRMGAIVFVMASLLAFKIPRAPARGPDERSDRRLLDEELHQPSIQLAGSAMAMLRGSVGFLAFFTAFALKDDIFGLGVALTAGAIGGFLGVIISPVVRRSVSEEVLVASALVTPAVLTLFGALVGGTFGFMVAAFAVAVGAAAGRLGFDSLLQRDGPDAVRGRSFARFETRFQLVWVIGGLLGLIPVAARFGLFVLSVVLLCGAASYVAALRTARRRGMRSQLMPDSLDRAITRHRNEVIARVRKRFKRREEPT